MIFRRYLTESSVIDRDIINTYDTLGSKEKQIRFIRDRIISNKNPNSLLKNIPNIDKIEDVIEESILEDGLSRNNDFLYFILDWGDLNKLTSLDSPNKKLKYLYDAHKQNNINLNAKVNNEQQLYQDLSLFDRPLNEFIYSVNTLNMIDNNSISEYLNNPGVVSLSHLYNNGKLKPSGIDKKDAEDTVKDPNKASTIYSVIEAWSRLGDEKTEQDIVFNRRQKISDKEKKSIDKIKGGLKELGLDNKNIESIIKNVLEKS